MKYNQADAKESKHANQRAKRQVHRRERRRAKLDPEVIETYKQYEGYVT